jgi:hypothetical protein
LLTDLGPRRLKVLSDELPYFRSADDPIAGAKAAMIVLKNGMLAQMIASWGSNTVHRIGSRRE